MVVLAIAQPTTPKIISVKTAQEFLKVLASNTIIEVSPGRYDLSTTTAETGSYFAYTEVHDGVELRISDLQNLTIRNPQPKQKVEFITQPSYGNVFVFNNCQNIKFENITAGHGEAKGYCTGGVLKFVSCQGISIENCNLYGSGMEGITAENVTSLNGKNVQIYECTYSLMSLNNVQNASFEHCAFTKSIEFDMLNLSDCGLVSFKNCTIADNKTGIEDYTDYALFNLSGNTVVNLDKCTISGNTAAYLSNKADALKMKNTKIRGNNRFTKKKFKE